LTRGHRMKIKNFKDLIRIFDTIIHFTRFYEKEREILDYDKIK